MVRNTHPTTCRILRDINNLRKEITHLHNDGLIAIVIVLADHLLKIMFFYDMPIKLEDYYFSLFYLGYTYTYYIRACIKWGILLTRIWIYQQVIKVMFVEWRQYLISINLNLRLIKGCKKISRKRVGKVVR